VEGGAVIARWTVAELAALIAVGGAMLMGVGFWLALTVPPGCRGRRLVWQWLKADGPACVAWAALAWWLG
jgi:hypothetical protein